MLNLYFIYSRTFFVAHPKLLILVETAEEEEGERGI